MFGRLEQSAYICSMKPLRSIKRTREFDEFYFALADRVQSKYDYVLEIVRNQYVVNKKFVKHLEGTPFYELRVSVSTNEYRTVIVAVDADDFMSSTKVLLMNSFLKKGTKQYKAEIKKAYEIFNEWRKEYVEDK